MSFKLFIVGVIAVTIFALFSGNQRKKHAKSREMREELKNIDFRHTGGDVWEDPTADDSPDLCAWEEENKLSDEVIEMDRRAAEEIMGSASEPAADPEPANPGETEADRTDLQ